MQLSKVFRHACVHWALSATDSDQRIRRIVFHVKCIWPTQPRGAHTLGHTQKRTHTCTVMQTHTGKERRSQRKLLLFIMPFYSMHTVLLPPLQMSVFHYVLNLSAGHSYDNSKSVLLPKCQEGEMTINRGSIKMNIKCMLKIRWAKWDKVRKWKIYYIKDSKNM